MERTQQCFGGINCDIGYLGFYEDCFAKCDFRYAIKGGPGTGKSQFMKKIAKRAEERGERVCRIWCGSDATSLDGVVLVDRGVGILDATAPHPWEPQMPGVDGEIWNLGQFWSTEMLSRSKEEIVRYHTEKKNAYASAYRLFSVMRGLRVQMRERILPLLDLEKMEKSAKGVVDRMKGGGDSRICQMSAIGMGGEVCLLDTEKPIVIGVTDEFGFGYRYLQMLHERAKKKGIACRISYHPVYHEEIERLTFEGNGVCYAVMQGSGVSRRMHMGRFLSPIGYVGVRYECREIYRLTRECAVIAQQQLSLARQAHFSLERIYTASMDFDRLEAFEKKQMARLLKE